VIEFGVSRTKQNKISEKFKMGFEGEELYFQMAKRVLCEKIDLRSNITSNMAKNVFFLLLG